MPIDWNFGIQKAMESNSQFTKDADKAFDDFCQKYLNSSNGLFINTVSSSPQSKAQNPDHNDSMKKRGSLDNLLNIGPIPQKKEPSKLTKKRKERPTSFYGLKVDLKTAHSPLKTDYEQFSNELDKYLAEINENKSSKTIETPIIPQKPLTKLGLKVVACGMRKYGQLPIPVENYFIEKGDFGDDAGFCSENSTGYAFGIADGATGNSMLGYDPGDFSRNLMESCADIYNKDTHITNARDLLLKAYDHIQNKTCYGSCTACVITLDRRELNKITAVNVGDSGYCLLREGQLIHKSIPQRISYACPKQLDSYPWKNESRIKYGVSYTDILGSDTMCESIEVQKGDILIVSSDGLYDNLDYNEIEQICLKSKSLMSAAEKLVNHSIKFYRKPDDILVMMAKIVETAPPQHHSQQFSVAPN